MFAQFWVPDVLLLNGFGGTPALELFLMVRATLMVRHGAGLRVARRHLAGSYVTSLETGGCSITVSALAAAQSALWDAPVHTVALRWKM